MSVGALRLAVSPCFHSFHYAKSNWSQLHRHEIDINLLNLLLEGNQISVFPKNVELYLSQKSTKHKESFLDRIKKECSGLSTHHVERKPILTLFTTNSTFHSFYSLSWQLLPTRGNSLESNCQESTALAFRERERERESVRSGRWRKKCGGTTGCSVKHQGSALLIPASH